MKFLNFRQETIQKCKDFKKEFFYAHVEKYGNFVDFLQDEMVKNF